MSKTMKNIGVALLSIGMIGGTIALGNHLMSKNTHETIHPTFEVGGLDVNGKYINDNSTIYTKQKFACDGLQATLDFDSTINYKVFYYDNVDNFLSSTDVLSKGYNNEKAPTLGAYARVMIIPTQDMDGKISWTEKYEYAHQLNLKVNKNADNNINKLYKSIGNSQFKVTDNLKDLVFERGYYWNSKEQAFTENQLTAATTKNLFYVNRINTKYVKFDISKGNANPTDYLRVVEYTEDSNGNMIYLSDTILDDKNSHTIEFNVRTKYVIFSYITQQSSLGDVNFNSVILTSMNPFI